MDCPICFQLICKSAVPSCSHHFCYSCLKKWCLQGVYKCPICKLDINEIKFDKEFDSINNKHNIEFDSINNKNNIELDINEIKFDKELDSINNSNNIIIIDFDNNDNAGITLENNSYNFLRRPGVRVKNIKLDKKMYKSGIRKNDIILFINNIPCSDHVNSINIINYSSANGKTITCELLK